MTEATVKSALKTQPMEVKVEYNDFGFVKDWGCPKCGARVKLSHVDDVGTKFFKCEKCGQCSSRLKSPERKRFEVKLKELNKPVKLEEISEILNSTIKHDERNKLITFLAMLLTYTEENQINLSFTAESSTGKSYIPLELAWYFPKKDVVEYSYVSPAAFYHEYGVMVPDPNDTRDVEDKKETQNQNHRLTSEDFDLHRSAPMINCCKGFAHYSHTTGKLLSLKLQITDYVQA